MNLLLFILLAVGVPVLPQPARTFAIVPPSRTIALEWSNSPTPGCSNRLYYGESKNALTNRCDVGLTNLCFVNVDNVRRYYAVKAVLDEVESAPSNVVKFPGDTMREFYAVKPNGEKVVLDTLTNTPHADIGLFKLNVSVWENYHEP